VHKVASLAKRWLLGTHQGVVDTAHLPGYLNEFVFRFNRRKSRSRGLVFYRVLELAVDHNPVRYRDLIKNPRPGTVTRRPPATHVARPPCSDHAPRDRGIPVNGYPTWSLLTLMHGRQPEAASGEVTGLSVLRR
jgi:hypothetical protein